jgi:AcrR family transcriptional regulator
MGTRERRAREKNDRRRLILQTATNIFNSSGVQAVTMDQIAGLCELSKGSLYLHFKSKSELIAAIVIDHLDELAASFRAAVENGQDPLQALQNIGLAYSEFQERNGDSLNLIRLAYSADFRNQLNPEIRQALQAAALAQYIVMAECIQSGIKCGLFRNDVDPMETAMIFAGSTMGVLQLAECHHDQPGLPPVDGLKTRTWQVLLKSIMRRAD